jgi:DNA repair ATPase RecN
MTYNYTQSPFLRAMIRKYEYQRDEAIAILNTYFRETADIDETATDKMDQLVQQLNNAEASLRTLLAHFAQQPQPEATAPAEASVDGE